MTESERLYARARQLMPWGTQTNSKRPDETLAGVMPFYIERAEGCRIQDVDGRWFIDYRAALGPIILGYKHPAVEARVRAQMEKGVLFSMASPIELEAAELVTAMVPGLEQVRFMKTGNEVNQAAVRLARAYTGREKIAVCGYHGHGDWFSSGQGKAPNWCEREGNGVPRALDALVTRLPYGDVEELERVFAEEGERFAALLMVPYDLTLEASPDFVQRARTLTEQYGTVLVFDQVITGFRLARGGAQEYFGVRPDLSTYAKALANGYPAAAFGGRREIMEKLYDVVITSTYAGETLSLAAACTTLETIRDEPVLDHIWKMGERLREGFNQAARDLGLTARAEGLAPAVRFRFDADKSKDERARRLFFRELYTRGIFAAYPFLLSYAHQEADVDETLHAIRSALEVLAAEPVSAV